MDFLSVFPVFPSLLPVCMPAPCNEEERRKDGEDGEKTRIRGSLRENDPEKGRRRGARAI